MKKPMIEYLPAYYRKSQTLADLFAALTASFDSMEDIIDNEALNLFITTATDFSRHEADAGITNGSSLDEGTRRGAVIAKLRGGSILTKDALRELIESFDTVDECYVVESFGEYTVCVYLYGLPENIDEISAAVEEVKPAHIEIIYAAAVLWSQAASRFATWNDFAELNWNLTAAEV